MGDVIVIGLIIIAVAFAVRYIKTKKSCSCGNGCDRCNKKNC